MTADSTIYGPEYMRFFGAYAGAKHRNADMPALLNPALTEWAEAHRKQACRDCQNDDACAEWMNHTACPARLRRTFKRAYRQAYRTEG